MSSSRKEINLPVVVLRENVMFPRAAQQFEIMRTGSIRAVSLAIESGKEIFITMQRDPSIDDPEPGDLHEVGVFASVVQVQKRQVSESMRIRVTCGRRGVIKKCWIGPDGMLTACVAEADEIPVGADTSSSGLMRALRDSVGMYLKLCGQTPPRAFLSTVAGSDMPLGDYVDFIAYNISLPGAKKQELLAQFDHHQRCIDLMAALRGEADIAALQRDIERKVNSNMEKNQHEYYLREKIRAMLDELGESDNPLKDADELREKIAARKLPEEVSARLLSECAKLAKLPVGSHESSVQRAYVDVCLDIPWEKTSKDKLDVAAARRKLGRDHFGLEKVKERILEFIAVKALAPDQTAQILCLVGPPGVGKTSIAKSIAEALGRQYQRLSLGGVHDEADIRGHRKTYIGAMPGRITHALTLAGVRNPLILLDEVDKLASDYRGDPTSALLELLDPEQNSTFHDHYIDIPLDLSSVLFITTANDAARIPAPLLDRMEVINLPSYTAEEKLQIAKKYLIKKQMTRHGLSSDMIRISDKGINAIIDGYTKEAGVRALERKIAALCRKAAKKVAEGSTEKIVINDKNIAEFLGPVKYKPDKKAEHAQPGMVNGLAFTSVGGTMLEIEAAILPGTGKIELTGSLGEVMRESARTAISFIRSRAEEWGIDPNFHKDKDIHIHSPEGAVPKDGPSAGITIATAVISALTGIPAHTDVAMTGEITLLGRVLPIGGLREKTMAAYRAGIKTVIIPSDNELDLSELSAAVRGSIHFIPVKQMDEVLGIALTRVPLPSLPEAAQKSDNIPNNNTEDMKIPPRMRGNHEPSSNRI